MALGYVMTLGITLDGKYVAAADASNATLVVIPITTTGFGAVASVLDQVAVPNNDQLLIQ